MRTYSAFWPAHYRFLVVFGVLLAGCGDVHLGTSNNDLAPSGTLLASGSFNSGQISGSVQIYSQNGGYILRLVGYSAPSISNAGAVITGNGQTVASIPLTISSGTKNYGFGAASGITFNAVTIRSLSNNTDYSVATLIQSQ
ncbi:MAG: hypothetical protein ACJ763_16910 [Bdellovibrionia bacterium]